MPVAVGQALTNASISWLLNKLGTEDVLDFIVKWKLDDQLLRDLKMRLLTINAVLNHAELKQVDDENVKDWLDEVNFSVYDAEDLLEEIAFDAIESKNGMNQAKQSNWLMQMDTQSWPNSSPERMYGNKKWAIQPHSIRTRPNNTANLLMAVTSRIQLPSKQNWTSIVGSACEYRSC